MNIKPVVVLIVRRIDGSIGCNRAGHELLHRTTDVLISQAVAHLLIEMKIRGASLRPVADVEDQEP
jgi:hypothetical protein